MHLRLEKRMFPRPKSSSALSSAYAKLDLAPVLAAQFRDQEALFLFHKHEAEDLMQFALLSAVDQAPRYLELLAIFCSFKTHPIPMNQTLLLDALLAHNARPSYPFYTLICIFLFLFSLFI